MSDLLILSSVQIAFHRATCDARCYVFDYAAEVRGFYRDFPAFQNLMFIETASRQLIEGNTSRMSAFLQARQSNNNVARAMEESCATGSCHASYQVDRPQSCAVLINEKFERLYLPKILGSDAPHDVETVFKLDHEIGHCISQKGHAGDKNMRECVADAYAALRHLQRFQNDIRYLTNAPAIRALEVVFRPDDDGNHFTSPVVEKIIEDSKLRDFSKLTPQQTIDLAASYAREYIMNSTQLSKMARAYQAFQGGFSSLLKGNMQLLHALGEYLFMTPDPAQFKWGSLCLCAILDGRVGTEQNVIKVEGDEWNIIRYALDDKERQLGLNVKPFTSPASSLILIQKR